MQTIYSIHAQLGGGGIGNTSYYAVLGPERAGVLKRVICSSNAQTAIPAPRIRSLGVLGRAMKRIAFADKSGKLDDWADRVFDLWSSVVLENCDVLHCWSDLSRTLARGKERKAVTILECMVHPVELSNVLQRESVKWEVTPADIPSAARLQRSVREIQLADFLAVPSEYVRQTHIAQGVSARKIHMVPYGVDIQRFQPSDQPAAAHPFRAVFVGNFSVRKGAPYLLEAWRQLGWQDAELWIVGNIAPEMTPLLKRWQNLSGLHLQGFHANIVDLYHRSDVFVFPSLGEGSALVTYEAMASGLPVIVTNNAGSLARADMDGYLIEPASVEGLANALERMRTAGPQQRQEMGRQARQCIEPYTWTSYGDRLLGVYQQVL